MHCCWGGEKKVVEKVKNISELYETKEFCFKWTRFGQPKKVTNILKYRGCI